jgi:hypothetical protein
VTDPLNSYNQVLLLFPEEVLGPTLIIKQTNCYLDGYRRLILGKRRNLLKEKKRGTLLKGEGEATMPYMGGE